MASVPTVTFLLGREGLHHRYHQPTAQLLYRGLYGLHLRGVGQVQQPLYLRHVNAQASRQFGFSDACLTISFESSTLAVGNAPSATLPSPTAAGMGIERRASMYICRAASRLSNASRAVSWSRTVTAAAWGHRERKSTAARYRRVPGCSSRPTCRFLSVVSIRNRLAAGVSHAAKTSFLRTKKTKIP